MDAVAALAKTLNVLIVEDDCVIQMIYRIFFKKLKGIEIDIVGNGQEVLSKNLSKYNLIISDQELGLQA